VSCRRGRTTRKLVNSPEAADFSRHPHDVPVHSARSDRTGGVDILTSQDLRSICDYITNGRCDERSIGSECHLSRIARTGLRRIRAVVHDVYDAAHHNCSHRLTLLPRSVFGDDLLECAVLNATSCVGITLLCCREDLESCR
jgi:hypothetical protein